MNVKIMAMTEKPLEVLYKAYRVCYSKEVPTEIQTPMFDGVPDDDKMIAFIERHINHGSPLEHVNITFAIEGVSRSLTHQLVRHRLASFSQKSQRYVRTGNLEYIIPPAIENHKDLLELYIKAMEVSNDAYTALVSNLMERGRTEKQAIEDARYVFPNAATSSLVMTMNLREFRHFYAERDCAKAQWEIRILAKTAMDEVLKILPFMDYKAKNCNVTCSDCFIKKV